MWGRGLIVGDAHLLGLLDPHLKSEMWGTPSSTGNLQPATPQLVLSSLAEHLAAEPLFAASEAIGLQTPFQIVFTSGTTSEPRGIVHTHRNILVSLEPIEDEMQRYLKYARPFQPMRFLHLLPLSHVFGQFMGLWCPALLGAEVHFSDEFEPARLIELIRRERVSVLVAVPRVLALLRTHLLVRFPELAAQIDAPKVAGARSKKGNPAVAILKTWWRYRRVHRALGWKFWAVISGGAALPAELETFWSRSGYALIQGYGMTETAALVTLNHPFHIKQGSIGKPLPGRDVQISADGEILVRGDMITGATWSGGAMHKREGEWLATGDLASASESGELKFLGRKGDVIVTSAGLNIHPADLESALMAEPGIRAVVVVACDLNAGPEPVAVVITALRDAELQVAVDAANRGLAEFQQVRRVLRWPEIAFPLTTTGKLIRREVAAWACGQLSGDRAGAAVSVRDSLLAVIAEVTGGGFEVRGSRFEGYGVRGVADSDSLRLSEDLHLDSLGRVQLQSALEQRFSVELDDDAIAAVSTVGDLRALMEGWGGGLQVAGSAAGEQGLEGPKLALTPKSKYGDSDSSSQNDGHGVGGMGEEGRPALRRPVSDNLHSASGEHVYPRWPWSGPIQALRVVWIECVMRPLVWVLAAPRVSYSAPLEPRTSNLEPLLIISNHITAYDGAFVLYALPRHLRRHVAAAMSGEMLLDFRGRRNQGNWFLNALAPAAYWLLTALFNVFPLPRARGFRRSFAHAGEAMDRGYSVLIFPEGTRSRIGRMNPFRPGIGLLAQQSRVPILPIALVGLYEFEAEAATRRWFHAGNVEVRVGEIIPAPGEEADPAVVTAQLERALGALLAGPRN